METGQMLEPNRSTRGEEGRMQEMPKSNDNFGGALERQAIESLVSFCAKQERTESDNAKILGSAEVPTDTNWRVTGKPLPTKQRQSSVTSRINVTTHSCKSRLAVETDATFELSGRRES